MKGMEGFDHVQRELKRIREIMKVIQDLKELRRKMEQFRDPEVKQEMIRHFIEEKKDNFWRAAKDEESLNEMREQCGYDEAAWEDLLRQLRS